MSESVILQHIMAMAVIAEIGIIILKSPPFWCLNEEFLLYFFVSTSSFKSQKGGDLKIILNVSYPISIVYNPTITFSSSSWTLLRGICLTAIKVPESTSLAW